MPRAWSEIEQSREFQDLSRDDREAARAQYWAQVIRPQIQNREDLAPARRAFFDRSSSAVAREQLPDDVQYSTAAGGGRGGQGGPTAEELAKANPPSLAQRVRRGLSDAFTPKPTLGQQLERPRPDDQPIPREDLIRASLSPAAAAERDAREVSAAQSQRASISASPEPGLLQRTFDLTNRKPLDNSLAGLAAETIGDAGRGAARGVQSIGQSAWGGIQAGAEAVGATTAADIASESAKAGTRSMNAIGSRNQDSLTQKVFESTFANVPILLGLGTGTKALAAMGAMSAGQAYHESRNRGMAPDEAAERAIVFGTAEMLGEKVGLPALGRLFSKAAASVSTKELGNALADLLVKEQVGEQATTAMQDAYDKFGRGGTRPGMTLGDYINDAIETSKVTLGQSLLMGGGAAVVNRLAQPKPVDPQVMRQAFIQVANDHGLSPKAAAAIEEQAAQLPPEQAAGFVERALAAVEKRGLVKKVGSALAWRSAVAPVQETQPEIINQPETPTAADLGWADEAPGTPATTSGTPPETPPAVTGTPPATSLDGQRPAAAWHGQPFDPAGQPMAGPDGRQYLPAMVAGKPVFIPVDEITQEAPADVSISMAPAPMVGRGGDVAGGLDQGGLASAGPAADPLVRGSGDDAGATAPGDGAAAPVRDELSQRTPALTTPAQPTTLGEMIQARPSNAPGFTASDVMSPPRAEVAPPEQPAAPVRRADFASEDEVRSYLSEQRRNAGIRISAAPVQTASGWSFVTKDEPGYQEALDAADARAEQRRAIDVAAHAAATSPKNDLPAPTEAQKEAGNYAKGHATWNGLGLTIENPAGSKREGVDPNGKPWSVKMPAHYGYIKRTEGADGDHVDIYMGPNPDSRRVFVVDQVDHRTGAFDEHKVVLGADSAEQAQQLYDAGFSDGKGPQRRAAMTEMSVDDFKAWARDGKKTDPLGMKQPAQAAPESADTTPAEAVRGAEPVVEHKTAKRTLQGYVRDITKDQALAIDAYTFRKPGTTGWFVRKEKADAWDAQNAKATAIQEAAAPREAAPATAPAVGVPVAGSAGVEAAGLRPAVSQAASLRAAGEKLAMQGAADQARDRLSNTARRARMASSADAEARAREAMGKTMVNLADAIERGDAPKLSGVTTKAQVETLEHVLRNGMAQAERELPYIDRERLKGRAPDAKDVSNAKLPQPSWNTSGASRDKLLEVIKGKKGSRELADMMRRGPPTAEVLAGLKKLGVSQKDIDYNLGWWNQEAIARKGRLARAGIHTDDDLRQALTEYLQHRDGPKAEDPIKAAERKLIGQKVGFDFFPTPKAVAERMVEAAGVKAGDRVLEPSAGNGNIADAAKAAGATVDVVEISDALRDVLQAKGHNLVGRDFMDFTPSEKYDVVLMNPPFSNRLDAEHIQRAFGMLKPGGRLIAIAGEGVFNGSDKAAKDFRDWLDAQGATVEPLPAGTFKDVSLLATTGANARLIEMVAPNAVATEQTAPDSESVVEQSATTSAGSGDRPEPVEREVAAPAAAPAPTARLTDAGEELIRNRRGKLKGLAWDDVSTMNDTLKVAQVVKGNVWPRPDYAKMVEDGAPAWKAAALKAVYDKLAAAPVTRTTPTDADLKAYIETLAQIREALGAELDRVEKAGGDGTDLWKTLKSGNVFGKVFPVPADARPVYGAPSPFDRNSDQGKENNRRALLIGGNSAVQALQFSGRMLAKVKDLLSDGFPTKQEAWQKSYEVRATETRDSDVPQAERTGAPQQRFYVYEKGSRWRLATGGQDGGYATQEQAEAFARTLTARKRETLPPSRGLDLANAKRTGPDWRGGKDVTAEQVMEHFGFRGVNLGEYVKAKQGVAQLHLNHVFDAFSDLADLLGVPPKAMSLNGTLGVAIGAQGSGKALAHFVPGVNEINITRDSGAGALAHEFGHALDHYFATQHGRAASMAKRPYLSAVVETIRDPGGVRPEVVEAMGAVMKAINSRSMTEAEVRKYIDDQRALNQRRMDRWVAEFKGNKGADPAALDAVAEKLKRGDVGEPQDTEVETNLYEFMRAAGLNAGNSIAANAFTTAYRLRDLADEARFMASHVPQVDTDYAKASAALDAKRPTGDGYWSTPWEKFARAFETFAMDALKDRQRESLYLSGLVDSAGWQAWSEQTGKAIPYPAGAERLELQQAFQKLVDTIETREDDAGNVAMFSIGAKDQALSRVQEDVLAITKNWANAPEVVMAFDMSDPKVPAEAREDFDRLRRSGASGSPEGFFLDGKVYLLASQIRTPADAARVLAHEALGHYGLRGLFGSDLNGMLDRLAKALPDKVGAKAEQYGLNMADSEQRRQAAEEYLAELAQTRPASTWVQNLIARVRAWLREHIPALADLKMTDAEVIAQFIAPARGWVERGRSDVAAGPTRFSLDGDADRRALQALSENDELFALPKSEKTTVEGIAADIDPQIQIVPRHIPGETRYDIVMPNGKTVRMIVRKPNPYGQTLYGFNQQDGELTDQITERPGENPEDVDPATEEVYIDASLLEPGDRGLAAYQIAATYAHNTGRIFIGDPAGLSDEALRRRSEQMLSSALKFGTTRHLAPHPRQMQGDRELGVPPLKWIYGDDIGNIERLIDLNVKAFENAFPDSKKIDFDVSTGQFINAGTGRVIERRALDHAVAERHRGVLAQRADPEVDQAAGVTGRLRRAGAGSRTVARGILLRALLREARSSSSGAGRPRGGDGVLARLARVGSESPAATRKVFYSLSDNAAAVAAGKAPGAKFLNRVLMKANTEPDGRLHWWHKTVGTMNNLAARSKPFARVYDGVQRFITDTSKYATEAAALAPKILPKLEHVRDILPFAGIGSAPLSPADNKMLATTVFHGTLYWTRGRSGKPVKVVDAEAAASGLDTDQKARVLLRDKKITPEQVQRMQANPLDVYDGWVRNQFESAYLRPGIVFTPDELSHHFGATDDQVKHYQQFRAAVDHSLTDLAVSDMLRVAGDDATGLADEVMGLHSVEAASDRLVQALRALQELDPGRARQLEDTVNTILDKADKAADLMARGYAPLMRFGTHKVDVVDVNGDRLYFGLFETASEARRMATKMREEFPDAEVTRGTLSQREHEMYAGVTPETLELFGEILGLDATGDERQDKMFQDYLRAVKNQRSALKRLIHRKGIAGFSEDAGRVLAGFVYSNARQTAGNLHVGGISQAIQDIPREQGEIKDTAIELQKYIFNPQEESQKIRGLLFAQYLGGSIASAMVNLSQTPAITFPYLSQYGGAARSAQEMGKAIRDLWRSSTGDAKLDAALKEAEETGIVAPQEVFQLMAQARGAATLRAGDGTLAGNVRAKTSNTLARLSLAWGKPFSLAEMANRKIAFIAAYRMAPADTDPAKFAEKTVNDTQFVNNKGNKPRWARGSTGSVLFTFKSYSVNYLQLLNRMWTQGEPGSPARRAGRRAVGLSLLMLWLFAGTDGLPGEGDAEDLVDGFLQRLGLNYSTKTAKLAFLSETLGLSDVATRFVTKGLSGLPGAPIDVSGRLGLGNLIPGTGLFPKKDDYTQDVTEIAGPIASFAKALFQGAGSLVRGAGESVRTGDAGIALEGLKQAATTVSPVAAQNLIKAVDMGKTGMYRDTKGRKVVDVGPADVAAKAVGFQPNVVARTQQANRTIAELSSLNKQMAADITDRWAAGIVEKDERKVRVAQQALEVWNRNNPESTIQPAQVRAAVQKKVRDAQMSKTERTVRQTPKGMRAAAARELMGAEE